MIQVTDLPAIAVQSLTKAYKGVLAVDGISFAIQRGSITGLLGGNGAGKTTTIGMILGLVKPTGGAISVLGHDMASDRHAVLHRMNFESPYVSLPGRLTVRQNLRVFAKLYGVPDGEARIVALAEEFDLVEFLDREAGQLSAGQKTRVALAKALINAPEVLLLDEPTASLDPGHRRRLWEVVADVRNRGGAVVFSTQNLEEVERHADRVVALKDGVEVGADEVWE
jgi:ABC-2 type transport system ATP-binding protein